MIKRTLFFRMMIDALDALSEKCGKLLDPHIEADLTGLFDEAIAEAKLEAVERFFLFDTEVKRGLYVEELKKAAVR